MVYQAYIWWMYSSNFEVTQVAVVLDWKPALNLVTAASSRFDYTCKANSFIPFDAKQHIYLIVL